MRKALIIVLCLASLGALANVQPVFAVTKRVCNTTIGGEVARQSQKCLKPGAEKYNCTTQYPVAGLSYKTICYDVEVQPGAASVTGASSPGTHYKAN